MDVEIDLGQQFLQLVVLSLKLTKLLGIGNVHAATLGPPFVESGVAKTARAAQFLDGKTGSWPA